ncbi:MAG TPA: hypothetical protein VF941_11950 [Clostridia bacterium]
MSKKYTCDVEGCNEETLRPITITIPPKKEYDLCEKHAEKLEMFLKGDKK